MKHVYQRHPRGYTMLMAMLVVVLATLLVAGAISFTGSERTAALLHTRSEALSACTQTARNMFLSRIRVLKGNVMQLDPASPTFDPAQLMDGGVSLTHDEQTAIQTRHYTGSNPTSAQGVQVLNVTRLPDNSFQGGGAEVRDISNTLGRPAVLSGHYGVTALCRNEETGAEQEVEFVVRLGL